MQQMMLKSCLLKYRNRVLNPYFRKWKKSLEYLRQGELTKDLRGRMLLKTNKYVNRATFLYALKRYFERWKSALFKRSYRYKKLVPNFILNIGRIIRKKYAQSLFTHLINNNITESVKTQLSAIFKRATIDEKTKLKDAIRLWLLNSKKTELKRFKLNNLKKIILGTNTKNSNRAKRVVLNAFKNLKTKGLISRRVPLRIGMLLIKHAMIHNYLKKLKSTYRIRKNYQLPRGQSLMHALMHSNFELGKNLAIRNILIRRYYKRWFKQIKSILTKESNHNLFKKLISPNIRNIDKLLLHSAFIKWKDNITRLQVNELEKEVNSKILLRVYQRNHLLCFKKYFTKWKNSVQKWYEFLAKVNKSIRTTKAILKKPTFNKLINYNTALKNKERKDILIKQLSPGRLF